MRDKDGENSERNDSNRSDNFEYQFPVHDFSSVECFFLTAEFILNGHQVG